MTSLVIPGELKETSLTLPLDLRFDEWERVGATLRQLERSVRWWLGDWMLYGERTYGEKYAQAIEVTGRTYSDLSSMASVASRVPVSNRLETLSWSHHAAVADLDVEAQREWLTAADENDWSKADLREQVKAAQKGVRVPKCRVCGNECKWCATTVRLRDKQPQPTPYLQLVVVEKKNG